MVGMDRPVGRVSWIKTRVRSVASTKKGEGLLRYLYKTTVDPELELGNIRTIDIDRSVGQDAATCTITMWNTHGTTSEPEGIDTAGRKGHLTPGRGEPHPPVTSLFYDTTTGKRYPSDWKYPATGYRDALIPNTIIKTFQGYGSDNFDINGNEIYVHDPSSSGYVQPRDDTQLYLTGIWLIDKVTFDAEGTMTLECRDFAKLLIEQIVYPPMIPMERFPLVYRPAHKATGHRESIGKNVAVFHSSSVDRKVGRNGSVRGHRGSHAFDTRPATFWLSGPNSSRSSVEWLQARTNGKINEVGLHCYGGNYIAYVSVHEGGSWKGASTVSGSSENMDTAGFFYVISPGDTLWDLAGTYYGNNFLWPRIAAINSNIIRDPHWIYPGQRIKIPYIAGTNSPPPGGGSGGGTPVSIKYVAKATISGNGRATIRLPRTYNAAYVRVTLTNLSVRIDSSWRAGIRTMTARNHVLSTYNPGTVNKASYVQDWSEPIKELCAWAGFTWPDASPNAPDPLLGRTRGGKPLRVWGDFERLGAGPIVNTPNDYFLSKSFMESIRQIVDFIGGIFYVDESAGAQFRLANIWKGGNFIDDPSSPVSLGARIPNHPIEFHEDANLTAYQMVIDDASLRSEILVVGGYPNINSTGPVAGGYVLGYNPVTRTTSAIDFTDILAGQYRLMAVPGDTTKPFQTQAECQRMAELTALFILFTYRQGTLSTVGHPGLQLDDQVRIFERTTNEANIHYVSAIRSHQDLDSGEYTMDVTTHWLGKDPNTDWFVNKAQLTPAVKQLPAILKRMAS